MDYAKHMSQVVNSVLIRSTMGTSEPRYRHVSELIEELGFQTNHINWARSSGAEYAADDLNRNLFKATAPYGAGFSNYFNHVRFNFYILKTLWRIKPRVIYACDFDTFAPSLLYRIFRPAVLIFDQFDPLSARVRNRFVKCVIDFIEHTVSKNADIRITANLERIPVIQRGDWIEIKNLFPLYLTKRIFRTQKNCFQLFYGGVLGNDRGLLECAKVIEGMKSWRLDIFGQGPIRNNLEELIGENIDIHNQLPHEDLMNYAQTADLYLALYDPSDSNNRLTASNKLYEAAQLGIPLLTSKGTFLGDIVQMFKLGWSVAYGNSEEIKGALDEYEILSEIQRAEIVDNLTRFFQTEIEGQKSSILLLENTITDMMKYGVK
jgi:glycosyltransferase involved in cell wall biosynthesis